MFVDREFQKRELANFRDHKSSFLGGIDRVYIKFLREWLASCIGMNRSSKFKILNNFQFSNIIEVK